MLFVWAFDESSTLSTHIEREWKELEEACHTPYTTLSVFVKQMLIEYEENQS